MQKSLNVLSLISTSILVASLAFAQSDTGALSGTITDPNGAAVAGAKLKIKNDQTGQSPIPYPPKRDLRIPESDCGTLLSHNRDPGI